MKKYICSIFFCVLLCTAGGCKKDPCDAYSGRVLGNSIRSVTFKEGTYWVYQDAATQQMDSQYVIASTDVYDTTYSWFSYYGCNVVTEVYKMKVARTIGSMKDTFEMGIYGEQPTLLFLTNKHSSTLCQIYDADKKSSMCLDYMNTFGSLSVSSFSVNNVSQFHVKKDSPCVSFYAGPTDVYIAPGWGIVKREEMDSSNTTLHTWSLLRYHIVN